MHKHCHHCGVDFEPEPGFYYGAMFVSYIGSGFFLMICALLAVFVLKLSLPVTLITLFVFILLVHAYLFKVSRSIWIHWFVKYDPQVPSIKP
ncbi:MAG: DUF983 domain-containing protein [Saprospiraceae bacterium]|nr:DUF983 domain-containing protein [Saprospiraceae bacterium]